MGYTEDLLASNETVVYETRKHWIAPLFATLTGTLLTVAGLGGLVRRMLLTDAAWLDTLFLWGGLLALLVGLALLAKAFVTWWSEEYFVTNQKVMKVGGIVRKTAEGSALEKINDIKIEQSLLGRWLGYGTLGVLTAADESNLHYTAMREPMEFRKVVLDQKQLFEQQDSRTIAEALREAQAPAAAAPAAAAVGSRRTRRSPTRSSAWPSCATRGPPRPRTSRPRRPTCWAGSDRPRAPRRSPRAERPRPGQGDSRRRCQGRGRRCPPARPGGTPPGRAAGTPGRPRTRRPRDEQEATPVVGHRDGGPVAEVGGQRRDPRLEIRAADLAALPAGPGADLRPPGTRGEVRRRLRARQARGVPTHRDLPVHPVPANSSAACGLASISRALRDRGW